MIEQERIEKIRAEVKAEKIRLIKEHYDKEKADRKAAKRAEKQPTDRGD